jgi:hypothetical protein
MQRDAFDIESSDDCELVEIHAAINDDNQRDIYANFSLSLDEFLTA